MEASLIADVPLGPFEGTQITVFSAKGKTAKLHASAECAQLRTRDVVETATVLDASTGSRLCARCLFRGAWSRQQTGLGIFLRALDGVGLLWELRSYTGLEGDEDWEPEEVEAAAEVLRMEGAPDPDGEDDAEDSWYEARYSAGDLRDRVCDAWRCAATSLHQAHAAVAMFPWLADWAAPKLAVKEAHLEALRALAAQLTNTDLLVAAAAAARLEPPELPAADKAFAVLGTNKDVQQGLDGLWDKWLGLASDGRALPENRTWAAHSLLNTIRSNRKGYGQALAAAQRLIASWEDSVRIAVSGAAAGEPEQVVMLRLREVQEGTRYGHDRGFLADLDPWTTGVLVTYLESADWIRRVFTVRVPGLVADRLRDPSLTGVHGEPEPEPTTAASDVADQVGHLRPGVFDDTPVADRKPLTADHMCVLRRVSSRMDELYIVFSTSGGAEVLPVTVIERRLARGWQGVIVAGASDLPSSLIEPWAEQAWSDADQSVGWTPRRDADDPRFGKELGVAEGGRRTAGCTHRDELREGNLRLLAMARGVHDLRTLGGYDADGNRRAVPEAVWRGLLAPHTLDLRPFEPVQDDHWKSGSGLPLGALADVQIYTTNADPRTDRRGHSPLCTHAHERGVAENDDLLNLADILGREDLEQHWCSKCGGYAARTLTDTQVSYYRAAHRMHRITQQLAPRRHGYGSVDFEAIGAHLDELAEWRPAGESLRWQADLWEWRRIVRRLRERAIRGQEG